MLRAIPCDALAFLFAVGDGEVEFEQFGEQVLLHRGAANMDWEMTYGGQSPDSPPPVLSAGLVMFCLLHCLMAPIENEGALDVNIRVLAGRLRLPAWTTTADFLEYIRKRWNGRPLNDDNTRRVFLIAGDDLTYGLNIYLKDQRAYYQLIEDANTRRARIKLSQTDNIMEFNYFYLRHDTGAYAMSHYTGCCTGMGDFERVLRKLFNHYTDDCGAREDNSGRRRLKKKGRAKFSRLCTEESWEDRVRDLESLNEITILEESSDDVCVEIVRASESAFTPSRIRSKRTTYTLQSTRPRDRVVEGLRAMYRKLRPKRASVAGKSASGDSVTVRIGEDAQVFDRLDYNSIVEQIDFDSFHRSTLMRQMLQFKDNAIMRAKLP